MLSHLEDENIKNRLRAELLEWLDIILAYGFNSSLCDNYIMKKYLPQVLMKHNKKQSEITRRKYVDALKGNATQEFVNNGFRVKNNQMNTYSLPEIGMTLFNNKRPRIGFQIFSMKL